MDHTEYLQKLDTALKALKSSRKDKNCIKAVNDCLNQFPPLELLNRAERFEIGLKLRESGIVNELVYRLLISSAQDLYVPALQFVTEDQRATALNKYANKDTISTNIYYPLYSLISGNSNLLAFDNIDEHNQSIFFRALRVQHIQRLKLYNISLLQPEQFISSILENQYLLSHLSFVRAFVHPTVVSKKQTTFWALSTSETSTISDALKFNRTLQSLSIQSFIRDEYAKECAFNADNIGGIFEGLANHASLINLKLSDLKMTKLAAEALGKMLLTNTSIQHLDLSQCELSNDVMEPIAAAIGVNTTLQSLDLSNNKLEGQQLAILSEGLKTNTALTALRLHQVKIKLENFISLSNIFGSVAPRNSTLTHLDLSGTKLSFNREEDVELRKQPFTHLFGAHSPLGTLNLARCRISSVQIPVIEANTPCTTSLTDLNLSGNYIFHENLVSFANIFTRGTSLQSLNLANNFISIRGDDGPLPENDGVNPLCAILRANTSMTSLSITNNFEDDSVIPMLKEAVLTTMIREPIAEMNPYLQENDPFITEFSEHIEKNAQNHKMKKSSLYSLLVASLKDELKFN